MTLIVNLLAGAGCGKSTLAAKLFYELKERGIKVELPREFAKDLTYAKRFGELNNQVYLLGKQLNRIETLTECDVIIVDSPIILSCVYNKRYKHLDPLILEIFHSFNNLNYLLVRDKPYQTYGRNQTEEEARDMDDRILDILVKYDIDYTYARGHHWKNIIEDILGVLNNERII